MRTKTPPKNKTNKFCNIFFSVHILVTTFAWEKGTEGVGDDAGDCLFHKDVKGLKLPLLSLCFHVYVRILVLFMCQFLVLCMEYFIYNSTNVFFYLLDKNIVTTPIELINAQEHIYL